MIAHNLPSFQFNSAFSMIIILKDLFITLNRSNNLAITIIADMNSDWISLLIVSYSTKRTINFSNYIMAGSPRILITVWHVKINSTLCIISCCGGYEIVFTIFKQFELEFIRLQFPTNQRLIHMNFDLTLSHITIPSNNSHRLSGLQRNIIAINTIQLISVRQLGFNYVYHALRRNMR